MYSEWVRQRFVAFQASAGEVVYIGDPLDVGDYEEIFVQVDVVGSNAATNDDVTWTVETSISADNFPKWDPCFAARALSKTAGTSDPVRITNSSTNPLRKWIRLPITHAVATANQVVTLHVSVLLKKRVP